MSDDQVRPVSRRDFLKKGAALGGAVFWVTPMVRAVGLESIAAEPVSPLCNVWYAVKIERELDPVTEEATTIPKCVDIYNQTEPNNTGKCLDVDLLPEDPVQGGCGHIVEAILAAEGAEDKQWKITLHPDCRYREGTGRCSIKTGGGGEDDGCYVGNCEWDYATRTLTFDVPEGVDGDISHVEFGFCCNS